MFSYCENNAINSHDPTGYRRTRGSGIWSFKSDSFGRKILWNWLFGKEKSINDTDGKWAEYLKKNKILKQRVQEQILPLGNDLAPGEAITVNKTFHMEIENGEDIIGYQYLHGTNATVGDFHIEGTITNIDNAVLVYDLTYTWNDIIDPNPDYASDMAKASLAYMIPFADPTDYIISITWHDITGIGIGDIKAKKGWLTE